MCTQDHLKIITETMAKEFRRIFGPHLRQVYLYGSYARGDYDDESDIDIVGIVDYSDAELSEANRRLSEAASDLGLKYDVLVSSAAIPAKRFNEYRDTLPYYQNILREGVELSAG